MTAATTTFCDSDTPWEAVVIGAGPAGALAAQQLATRGVRTLLVEAKRFPRAKVCGGCLNHRGITALATAGMSHVLDSPDRASVKSLHWIVGSQRARFALPETQVVDRASFDSALVDEAIRAGATFWDGTQACIEPQFEGRLRTISVTQSSRQATIRAKIAICADGLSRTSVKRLPEFRSLTAARSRIGLGVTIRYDGSLPHDEITMVVGRPGYVGLAYSGNHRLNLAAAIDPEALSGTTASELVAGMLRDAAVDGPDDWNEVTWHGTPPLTSRPNQVAGERLFVIGDASGYVEPFSGEGMATALETALAVVPLATAATRDWRPSLAAEWTTISQRLVDDGQSTCRQLAWMLRRPLVAAMALRLCRAQPWVARRFIAKVS